MVNQLGKFIPELAEMNKPLRQLLKKDHVWQWGPPQAQAFQAIKVALTSPPTLAHYDCEKPTVIAADACMYGLGAVLLQIQDDGSQRPICFASRSLTETEQRYAVIEKEALAKTWACEKFADYITGLDFTLETDHKPLVSLLSSKDLSQMPPRILRFRLRLMRFNPSVQYVQGKLQITADALSRAPVHKPSQADNQLIQEVETFSTQALHMLPASTKKLKDIQAAQKEDDVLREVMKHCTEGWPAYLHHSPILQPYWENQAHLAVVDELLTYDQRIVVPKSMRLEMLSLIHVGHLGITKCGARAREALWWPGMAGAIEEMVSKCQTCQKALPTPREPLKSSSFPSRPWERVGMDLFEFRNSTYLLVVDYYSRWTEVKKLSSLTSEGTITALKGIFATHGIPDLAVSDNGPQFCSQHFSSFARDWGFSHVTSSPLYPQSNGEAERAVRTMKSLLKKNTDPYLAILSYRATPLQNGLTPSELLMSRKLKTQLPVLPGTLMAKPNLEVREQVMRRESSYREKQAAAFNNRHRTQDLPQLQAGERVWVRDQRRHGTIVAKTPQPRSYVVKTNLGTVRRNRSALVFAQDPPSDEKKKEVVPAPPGTPEKPVEQEPGKPSTPRRSGRECKPSQRLIEQC